MVHFQGFIKYPCVFAIIPLRILQQKFSTFFFTVELPLSSSYQYQYQESIHVYATQGLFA